MGKRARVKDNTLLHGGGRLRPIAAAMTVILAGSAAADSALAQSPWLFSPDSETANPSFNRNTASATDRPGRFERILTDGNAPPSGAGQSGFISASPSNPPDGAAAEAGADSEPDGPSGQLLSTPTGVGDGPPATRRKRRRGAETEDPYEPLGLRVGSFIVKPAIELSGGYDSNPERSGAPRGNSVLVVAPELQIRSNWSRHELNAGLRGRYTTYPGFQSVPSLNQPFVDATIAARIDVTRRTRLELEGRFRLSTENPSSPDLQAGLARLPITTTGGVTAGVTQQFNRLEIGVSGSYDRSVYGDSALTSGAVVSNQDRNYHQTGVKLRSSYELVPGIKPFVEVGADRRIHDLPVDSAGFQRDSTGYEGRLGTTFELTRQLVGSVSAGYATRDYADPALNTLSGLIADGSLAWAATPLTTVTFTARSQIAESTLLGVSGVLRRDLAAQVDHSFRRWLIGTVKFEYGLDDYVGSTREDQRYAVSGLLTYKMSRNVHLKGEIRRQWLTSNAGADYSADIFLLGIRLQQ